MASVAANGITIEYESLGDPAAPPILLIMGLGMQLVAWPDAFCQGLVERGFRVIRFDNRDCGLSSKIRVRRQPNLVAALAAAWLRLPVRAPYTLDDMAADTVALLDALAIPRAHVVGLSMGGMIAQVVAARYPDRVQSLTSIMSSSGRRKVSNPQPEAKRALLSKPADPGDPDVVIEHLVGVFGVIGSPGFPTDRAALREQVARNVRRGYYPAGVTRQLVAVIASGDRRRLLRKIGAPTLVIHGAADPLVPVEAGRDTARHIVGAKLEVIDGMGARPAAGAPADPRRGNRRALPGQRFESAKVNGGLAPAASLPAGCLGYMDRTHFTRALFSSGDDLTLGWPLAESSAVTSLASASALPLYLAAISLNPGPIFLASTAWHVMQPDFCARSASPAAFAAPATANPAAATATSTIDFIFSPCWMLPQLAAHECLPAAIAPAKTPFELSTAVRPGLDVSHACRRDEAPAPGRPAGGAKSASRVPASAFAGRPPRAARRRFRG